MDRQTTLLQQLRAQLGPWLDVIRRGVGATAVEVVTVERGEFFVRATWKVPDGERMHEQFFSRDFVFGSTAEQPLACRAQRRPCDYARDFMREILTQRGVI